jgi:pentatricopeptide repeat protein
MGDKRDLVSSSAMVSCFANNDLGFEATGTFLEMLENGFFPKWVLLRGCANADNITIGKMIFGFVIKSGYFESDLAYKAFEKMSK